MSNINRRSIGITFLGFVSLAAVVTAPGPAAYGLMLMLFLVALPHSLFRGFLTHATLSTPSVWRLWADRGLLGLGALGTVCVWCPHSGVQSLGIILAGLGVWCSSLETMAACDRERGQLTLTGWSLYASSGALLLMVPVVGFHMVRDALHGSSLSSWVLTPAGLNAWFLPSLGLTCEMISRRANGGWIGRTTTLVSFFVMAAFAMLGSLMNVTPFPAGFWGFFNLLALIPLAVIVFDAVATLAYGIERMDAPLGFAVASLAFWITGAASALVLVIPGLETYAQETWWAFAYATWSGAGAVAAAYFAGLYDADVHYSRRWAEGSIVFLTLTLALGIVPRFMLGAMGVPLHAVAQAPQPFELALLTFSKEASVFLLIAYVFAAANLLRRS